MNTSRHLNVPTMRIGIWARNARAVRCAFWLGFRLLMRGEMGRASGWFARAQRLLERDARECAERGYLLLPTVGQGLVLS